MTLNEYQEKAMTTCMPSSENFSYMMLNLVGEVGEFASKVAKAIRKGRGYIGLPIVPIGATKGMTPNDFVNRFLINGNDKDFANDFNLELQKEAGDILWQLSGLCHVMGWTLEDVAQQNLDKLASRQDRGVIDGNGDNR